MSESPRPSPSRALVIVAGLLACAVAAGAYFLMVPSASVTRPAIGTAVHAVPGTVAVREAFMMEIKSESGGRVTASALRPGARVKRGDVLLELDPADLLLELERLESDHRATRERLALGLPSRFELANAEENFQTNARLLELGRYPKAQLARDERALEQLRDRIRAEEIQNALLLASQENSLRLKKRQIEKLRLAAPENGVVHRVHARPGDLVAAGMVLAEILSDEREVELRIGEENIAGIRPGLKVQVQFLGYGGRRFEGVIDRLLPAADERTRRYTAFLNLDIAPELLVPGLSGEASVTVDRRENALLVERRALVGSRLLVVRGGRIRAVPVETGFTGLDRAEVTAGVTQEDRYVVDNVDAYADGQRVRAVESQR